MVAQLQVEDVRPSVDDWAWTVDGDASDRSPAQGPLRPSVGTKPVTG